LVITTEQIAEALIEMAVTDDVKLAISLNHAPGKEKKYPTHVEIVSYWNENQQVIIEPVSRKRHCVAVDKLPDQEPLLFALGLYYQNVTRAI
ncbi:hypothetical protein, partial [uncultured Legionella sp.]|uniref:hypothetical protein n=1 Tax=uncultured Legionella sp. TaxID=210934 RepID=UPI0026330FF6